MITNDLDAFGNFDDFSDNDFRILNEATQVMGLTAGSSDIHGHGYGMTETQELAWLREQLAQANRKMELLEKNVQQAQQEKFTKEGEAAILRERLNNIETERTELLTKTNDRLQQSETCRMTIEEEYKRTMNALKSEITFKDQEIESLTCRIDHHLKIDSKSNQGSGKSKERRVESIDIPKGFESLAITTHAKKRPISEVPAAIEAKPTAVHEMPIAVKPSDQEILDMAIACVEFKHDYAKILTDYDYAELLRRKDQLHRDLLTTGSLLAALEIAYDGALKWLRQVIFLYFSRLIATVLSLKPELGHEILIQAKYGESVTNNFPTNQTCGLFTKMCLFVGKSPFGLHPLVQKSHLDCFKRCITHAGHSVPLELKNLLESGHFAKCLGNLSENHEILIDFIQLLALMSRDRTAVSLFLKPSPAPIDASILAIIVKIGITRFQKSDEDTDCFLLALTEFLLHLARRNIVPLQVAFDPRFLRELVHHIVNRGWYDHLDHKFGFQWETFIQALHFVFVEKGVPIRETLNGLHFALHYLMEELAIAIGSDEPARKLCIELLPVTSKAIEAWLNEREQGKIDRSRQPKIGLTF